ncbi:methyltransferase domain-containing protein [Chloroflexota bacterium]
MITSKNSEVKYWGQIATKIVDGQDFDELLAEQYRRVHLNLIARWTNIAAGKVILKTDLFAEAQCPSRAFLGNIFKTNCKVIGIDICTKITSQAKTTAAQYASDSTEYVNCDVRQLPFTSNSFDLIVSDSTLDHFHHKDEIITALSEFSRVLKPDGTLIITMDNKDNLTEPLFRLWISFGLAPFFIGKTYSIKELKQALARVGLRVMESTAIIHNPRFFTRTIVSLIRHIKLPLFDHWIRRGLVFLDGLENRKMKYLTAQFIAVKATKPNKRLA